jgi:prepilin-type processing-associated H-X9-DG protein
LELLTVTAVIGVLASMVASSVSRAKRQAQAAQCITQFQQFGIALQMYGDDSRGRLPPNRPGQGVPDGQTWVQGWLGVPGPDCTNTVYLRQSLLSPYLGSPSVWRCPAARPVELGGQRMDRVRTISLNGFLGDSRAESRGIAVLSFADVSGAGPAGIFSWVEERIDTINDGSFGLQTDFSSLQPNRWILRDKPSALHAQGGHLTFLDGHVERNRWLDSRTLNPDRNDSPTPGNPDVAWLQARGRPLGEGQVVSPTR